MPGVRAADVPLFRYRKPPPFFLGCPSFKAPEPSKAAQLSEQSATSPQQQQQIPLPVPERERLSFHKPRLLRSDWLIRLPCGLRLDS